MIVRSLPLLALLGCDGEPAAPPPVPTDPHPDDGAVHDPLSMPAAPTLDPGAFASSGDCVACHPDHVAEWQTSMHAYAMIDPLYRALVLQRQADLDGTEDQFCTQCHSAIGTRGGEVTRGFSFDTLSPIVQEGVTCTACHQIVDVARDYNSGHVLDPDAPVQGPIRDPVAAAGGGGHASAYAPLFEDPVLCGGCHDVIETSGLDLERPYREWTQSPAFLAGETCQDCHMRPIDRPAATGGPARTTHEHRWVGVDVPLEDGFLSPAQDEALRASIRELLTGVATLELGAPGTITPGSPFDLTVTVHNDIAGHNLPTGSTFVRQMWLHVVATDAEGHTLFETGQLDANGDLMDAFSTVAPYADVDLVSLSSGFVDPEGARTVFSWVAAEHTSRTIPPGYSRTSTLFVPTEGAVGPVTVTARLQFRAVPPFLLRQLGLEDAVDRIEIHTLAEDTVTVTLSD